ncbi:MAG TPA: fluoride efflux transporter CrcB [Thermoanaerobaculia bacterium]|nr:fluoride efflux transporter CrcB [Thermoanaerobaculia bacterium]
MSRLAWICLGGALGTGARYLLSGFAAAELGTVFPWGTLAVNVIGSLLLGAIMHVGLTTSLLSPTLRMTLGTGVLGGFTTYSTFNYETLRQLQDGAWPLALTYVGVTLFGCLAAGWAGVTLARAVWGG